MPRLRRAQAKVATGATPTRNDLPVELASRTELVRSRRRIATAEALDIAATAHVADAVDEETTKRTRIRRDMRPTVPTRTWRPTRRASSPEAADDPLILIDQGARHRAGGVAEQEHRQISDLLGREQPAERLRAAGALEPALAVTELDRLHVPLGGRIGPSQENAIHADPIRGMGVGDVFCQHGERALRGRIDGEQGVAAMDVP